MAEKRQREESLETMEGEISKRSKPFDHILSILEEEEEEEPKGALEVEAELGIFTTLQQEISSSSSSSSESEFGPIIRDPAHEVSPDPSSTEDDDRIDVIRHLLEASDDELGIPNLRTDGGDNADENGAGGQDFPFSLCDDGLWEFEDQSANYYSLLQAELFM
nr:putative LisH domain-containing protein C1711.05-like protein [Ipomoea batatas]